MILFLTSSFPTVDQPVDGIFILELAKKLSADFSISILAPETPGPVLTKETENLRVYRFQYFWPKAAQKLCSGGGILPNLRGNPLLFLQIPFLFAAEFFAARKIIRENEIDLIHAHWLIPQGFVAACLGIPFIVTVHGGDVFGFGAGFFITRWMAKFALDRCRSCTVNSSASLREIKKISKDVRVQVIPMGVDLNIFKPSKRIKRSGLLFVGRLSPEKGVKYLLAAMPEILKNFKNVKLKIIGDGPERQSLERIALVDAVEFLGTVSKDRLPKYYRAAEIFVGPSLREGLGMALIEAGLCGCALIGTNVGGIPDLIKNGETGLLVEPKNAGQISAAVLRLLRDSQLRRETAAVAQGYFKAMFGWDKITARFRDEYLSILLR